MKRRKWDWIMGWVGVLVLVVVPAALVNAQDQLGGLHPYLEVREEYNDNITLARYNTISDFITTVFPGLRYTATGAGYNFDLDYNFGLNFYASNSHLNYVSQRGRLNMDYSFTPRWTFRLNETLTQSRDGVESYTLSSPTGSQNYISSTRFGDLYLRNIFNPALEYRFGQENLMALRYRNMIYRIVEGTGEDSTENFINPQWTYWFNIRNGIVLDYSFSTGQFERSLDWVENTATGRYNYRFNPRTMFTGYYRFSITDYEAPGIDYTVHSFQLGFEHAFSPSLNGQAGFGWFWQTPDFGPSINKPVYNMSITQSFQRTNYTMGLDGGYRQSNFTAENQGFTWYNQIRANVTHRLWERMSLGLTGALIRDEYNIPYQVDLYWDLVGSFSYQPLRWLTISLEASTRSRDSDREIDSYQQNRVFLSFKAQY
jgi:hypothetical protein